MPTRLTDNDHQPDHREQVEHDPRCRNGWIGGRLVDNPRPCPTCKPWLTTRRTDGPPVPRKATR